jgi:hypothetical protein
MSKTHAEPHCAIDQQKVRDAMPARTLFAVWLAMDDGQRRVIVSAMRLFVQYATISDEIREELEAEYQRLDRQVQR